MHHPLQIPLARSVCGRSHSATSVLLRFTYNINNMWKTLRNYYTIRCQFLFQFTPDSRKLCPIYYYLYSFLKAYTTVCIKIDIFLFIQVGKYSSKTFEGLSACLSRTEAANKSRISILCDELHAFCFRSV